MQSDDFWTTGLLVEVLPKDVDANRCQTVVGVLDTARDRRWETVEHIDGGDLDVSWVGLR